MCYYSHTYASRKIPVSNAQIEEKYEAVALFGDLWTQTGR